MATRIYNQQARARSTAETRRAVLDAAQSLAWEEACFDPPLERVAERAGVTKRTILRHFGSKEGLIRAATRDAEEAIVDSRAAPPGDVETAITKLIDHYEELGERVLALLAEEQRRPDIREVTDSGRELHRRWVEDVFAPDLEAMRPAARRERIALLASVTDVHVWGVLRREHGLSRDKTEAAMRGLADHARGDSQ